MMGDSYNRADFLQLQRRLGDLWPLALRDDQPRAVVVVSSLTAALPEHIYPVIPAYEERYLFFVLGAARAARTHVVYVTSQPIPQRVVDYYMHLTPGVSAEDLRQRVTLLSVCDWTRRPLVEKILERPGMLERIRSLIGHTERRVLLPFVATGSEAQLALRLGIPMYGPDPDLAPLGTKSEARRVFAAAGVPVPPGVEDLRDRGDLVSALVDLQRRGGADEAIVKLDFLGGGLGNATVRLDGACDRRQIERCVDGLRPEDDSLSADAFLALMKDGAIVEERLSGDQFRSPSVQLRNSPMGDVEVVSTHDQLLGGSGGQTFFGCVFPAEAPYRSVITGHARAIGSELARRGVVGRFAIDFVTARMADGSWQAHAIDLNLRNGGTTHPALTLLCMTDGRYDEDSGDFFADGTAKYYVASDHLEHPAYQTLTPDDALDVLADPPMAWDPHRRVGAVFHMTSAVAIAGRLGVTAIGDSRAEARSLYEAAQTALDDAAEIPLERRNPFPW
jgi:hypothetical protein